MENRSTPTRWEKSLGELCIKFLNNFGGKTSETLVNLDDCKDDLGIKRRRIYDIVNILESIEMIKRRYKNVYCLQPPAVIKKRIEAFEVS